VDRLARHDIIALVSRSQAAGSDPADGDEFMTTDELARLLRVDPSSVRRWRTATPMQGPPYVRLSERVVKYRREDVECWLAGRRVDPAAA
jgi:predicted DNA-binding transcriptional regulator AlpA